ncbi:MAG: CHASE2 domain-containing protein [Elusimicrobia bacterium]|nr:CHASE2 domain-containing protein [Elusimicrobiota bacterium]
MKKKKGLLIDAVLGLLLTAAAALGYRTGWGPLAALEFKAYDLRSVLRQSLKTPDEIVLVAIDDDSIAQIGRWPWPRSRIAAALDAIARQHPRVVGLDILYSEAERDSGRAEIQRLRDRFDALVAGRRIFQKRGTDFDAEFSSSAAALDSDGRLIASIRASNDVVLPLFFAANPTRDKPNALPPQVSSSAVRASGPAGSFLVEDKAVAPLTDYAAAAEGLAHVNLYPESDGVLRRDASLVLHDGLLYPSFALRLAMAYVGATPAQVKLKPGVLTAGRLSVPLDADGMMPITFLGPPGARTIKRVSFQQVVGGALSPDYFKDKLVIVGPTASGVGNDRPMPLGGRMSDVEIFAHAAENVIDSRFLTQPPWAPQAEWGMLAAIGLFLTLILPRLRAFWGLVASLLIGVGVIGAGTYYFVLGQWIQIAYALSLLLTGYLVIVSRQFLLAERGKELVEASAIETNKMLGLSFQGQGMLDLAFEKFRLCPLDGAMKELLYNLALDFERKRMFSKAASVLGHIVAEDAGYKDAAKKIETLKAASDGAVFGGVGGRKDGTALLTSVGGAKPTLGRYEIDKELGRGAMGVVYLGRDPKINRQVAIKTMMLEEGEGGASKEVKERFFREAESAGTLNHPNIVRIFDAGEENDVAYIAMELLDGHDLIRYTVKNALLPVDKVLEYIAIVADALDYAHRQGIVHRDIKPANVMLLKDGGIRVADFGIARITASSKTATGTVMGTPSYMSPEQVAGRKVDGRSDLFSLTVALYELLTGEKPFKGGDGIGTLLFQIANDPHPDIRTLRDDLPSELKTIIDKGLAKNPGQRYQRGADLATALRSALAGMKAGALETILPAAPNEERRPPQFVPPPERTEERTLPMPAVPVADAPPQPATAAEPEPAPQVEMAAELEAVESVELAEEPEPVAEAEPTAETEPSVEAELAPEEVVPEMADEAEPTLEAAVEPESVAATEEPAAEEPAVEPVAEATAEAAAVEPVSAAAFVSDKTITMPVPAVSVAEDAFAEPAAESGGMRIELGPRSGIGGAGAPPPPPPPKEAA